MVLAKLAIGGNLEAGFVSLEVEDFDAASVEHDFLGIIEALAVETHFDLRAALSAGRGDGIQARCGSDCARRHRKQPESENPAHTSQFLYARSSLTTSPSLTILMGRLPGAIRF